MNLQQHENDIVDRSFIPGEGIFNRWINRFLFECFSCHGFIFFDTGCSALKFILMIRAFVGLSI